MSTSSGDQREPTKGRTAWGLPAKPESRWAPRLAILVALILYVRLSDRYTLGPVWVVPTLEGVLLIALFAFRPLGMPVLARSVAIALIGILTLANLSSLILLVRMLAYHGKQVSGHELLNASINIWVTNVIIFALWYWELDRGGPDERCVEKHDPPDFLFPQMVTPAAAPPDWSPRFVDYLFVSFTNATAFSPTDTMPLTRWAKALMMVQALISILAVTLVAARAVNILS
jgi:hypothetical protein